MLENRFCRDPDSADSSDKGYFRSFRTMHSSHMLREGARPEIVRQHGSREYRRDPDCLRQELVGRASGCGHPSCRSRNQCRSKYRERREKESAVIRMASLQQSACQNEMALGRNFRNIETPVENKNFSLQDGFRADLRKLLIGIQVFRTPIEPGKFEKRWKSWRN